MRGGSLRFMSPRRLPQSFTISSGNQYYFGMSDNTTQDSGIGGLVNSVQASTAQASYPEWKAFDKLNATGNNGWWAATGTTSSWLRVNFNYAIVVRRIDVVAQFDYPSYAPKTFTIEASNDGSIWATLATRTNEAAWFANERRSYTFSNGTAYLHYRINVTDIENLAYSSGCVHIGELEFFD